MKKRALIQIDCDTLTELEQCYNLSTGISGNYLVNEGFANMCAVLNETPIPVTLFLVGKTLEDTRNRQVIETFLKESTFPVEIGSHSMTHPYEFHRLSHSDRVMEVFQSKAVLEDKLQTEVSGFKAPSYFFDRAMPEIIESAGYRYDSSLWPSSAIIPVKMVSGKYHNYGKWKHFFYPNRPFIITPGLWEIPVSCTPFLRFPLHSSFLLALGRLYQRAVLTSLKFLPFLAYSFHLVDFVEVREPKLQKLPGYHLPWKEKKKRLKDILDTIQNDYTILQGRDLLRELEE